MRPPSDCDDWVALTDAALSLDEAASWVAQPSCGAVVTFSGNVRDHSDGRNGVSCLEYEAYTEVIEPRMAQLAAEARHRWPGLGRIVCWHRTGALGVGESAVIVAVSSAHRADAFDAARWCIDTVKATLPIWKRETWADGEDWAACSGDIVEVGSLTATEDVVEVGSLTATEDVVEVGS